MKTAQHINIWIHRFHSGDIVFISIMIRRVRYRDRIPTWRYFAVGSIPERNFHCSRIDLIDRIAARINRGICRIDLLSGRARAFVGCCQRTPTCLQYHRLIGDRHITAVDIIGLIITFQSTRFAASVGFPLPMLYT